MSKLALKALVKKYEAEMESALINISVYENHPVGIGEHPDIVEAVETQVKRYVEHAELAEGAMDILAKLGG